MGSNSPSSTAILISVLLCLALTVAAAAPCDQPKIKPSPVKKKPAIPKIKPSPVKKKPAVPKIIRPPSVSSPAVKPEHCPKDTLKLGACTNILGIGSIIGSPVSSKCCALLTGLTDLEAAACLCTAIKANVLGVDLNVPVSLSLVLSSCQKSVPDGYQCK